MKKIILSLLVVVALTACSNHGKKVKIEGSKGEVFYKGDGVTEDDAKKLGKFLKEQEYFDDSTKKSVQLMKAKNGGYDVRFVVDEKKLKEIPDADDRFILLGAVMSNDVFDKQPVNIFLADDGLKDFKTLAYDKKKAEELLLAANPSEADNVLADYDHDTMEGITFYWKNISDDESKTIAEYIVKNGSFTGGSVNIVMTKEGDRYIVKFPITEAASKDVTYLGELEKVTRQIKDNVFADNAFSFYATDEKLTTLKTWDY